MKTNDQRNARKKKAITQIFNPPFDNKVQTSWTCMHRGNPSVITNPGLKKCQMAQTSQNKQI